MNRDLVTAIKLTRLKLKMRDLLYFILGIISVKLGSCHFKKSGYGLPYRGRYTGSCRGDGLYYRDSYSFVTCTHSIGYLQPCPPGTRNKKYDTYGSRGGAHFCTENLVNLGYTVYNKHPLHGPRSLKSKPKRYLDRQRGYSSGRVHRQYRLRSRHKRPPRPAPPPPRAQRFVYAKPEGRMFSGHVENRFYEFQRNPEVQHHHTGPEFHGPYRDQAKSTSESKDTMERGQTDNFQTHTPSKMFSRAKSANGNEITSDLEHPMLTFHHRSKSKKTNIDVDQIRLVQPRPDSEYQTGRKNHEFYRNPSSKNHSPLGRRLFRQNQQGQKSRYSAPEYNMSRHVQKPPKLRVDLTRIKLVPPTADRHVNQRPEKYSRELSERQYTNQKPEFKVSLDLLQLKKKILAKYARQHMKNYRHPIYDQYSQARPKVSRGSRARYQQMRPYSSHGHPEVDSKRPGMYRYESERSPPVANDQSKKADDDDEKLLMTVIGVDDEIISYDKASDSDKFSSAKYSGKVEKTDKEFDWRSETYKVTDYIK